jgi:hypothetical protein
VKQQHRKNAARRRFFSFFGRSSAGAAGFVAAGSAAPSGAAVATRWKGGSAPPSPPPSACATPCLPRPSFMRLPAWMATVVVTVETTTVGVGGLLPAGSPGAAVDVATRRRTRTDGSAIWGGTHGK